MIKIIRIEESIFQENEKIADQVRNILRGNNILGINVMGAPGSGKTSFIERTIDVLKDEFKFGVIEGDVEGKVDSEKFLKFNISVIQINTGGGCHLDANMVKKAVSEIDLEQIEILFIENVGNLICPAEFDIGTEKNIVISSITEGDDKIEKYPLIFKVSDLCILNKIDLVPYLDFDFGKFENDLKNISSGSKLIKLSSKTGENFNIWIEYLKGLKREKK
ncbi:MAG: hydrogenase nickel incorporation protein HypB [Candidatus Omnitrophica bacterium]|nr:hydrogenase nickel incorporation protein HypB [Candidatus Omnitrophota bacterium]MCM8802057.1 hydrogenase nickel incorporation protein HypB [Candidatus Omnitrophota bacterium]